jgi:hypothetical protein
MAREPLVRSSTPSVIRRCSPITLAGIAEVARRFKPQPVKPVTTASRAGIRNVHLLDGRHESFFSQPTTLTDILINARN